MPCAGQKLWTRLCQKDGKQAGPDYQKDGKQAGTRRMENGSNRNHQNKLLFTAKFNYWLNQYTDSAKRMENSSTCNHLKVVRLNNQLGSWAPLDTIEENFYFTILNRGGKWYYLKKIKKEKKNLLPLKKRLHIPSSWSKYERP